MPSLNYSCCLVVLLWLGFGSAFAQHAEEDKTLRVSIYFGGGEFLPGCRTGKKA